MTLSETLATYVYGAYPRDVNISAWNNFCAVYAGCGFPTEAEATQGVVEFWSHAVCQTPWLVPYIDWYESDYQYGVVNGETKFDMLHRYITHKSVI
jgi:hypothetical protein